MLLYPGSLRRNLSIVITSNWRRSIVIFCNHLRTAYPTRVLYVPRLHNFNTNDMFACTWHTILLTDCQTRVGHESIVNKMWTSKWILLRIHAPYKSYSIHLNWTSHEHTVFDRDSSPPFFIVWRCQHNLWGRTMVLKWLRISSHALNLAKSGVNSNAVFPIYKCK